MIRAFYISQCLISNRTRMEKLESLIASFEANKERETQLADKAVLVVAEVGSMDVQQVNEQTRAVERRMADLKKRIDRKKQLVEMAEAGFKGTKQDIADTSAWIADKMVAVKAAAASTSAGGEQPAADVRLAELRSLGKEVDSKTMVIETFENKIETITSDLEASEVSELKAALAALATEHTALAEAVKAASKALADSSDYQKKFTADFADVEGWLKNRSAELAKASEFDPLKAYDAEKRVARLKKEINEVSIIILNHHPLHYVIYQFYYNCTIYNNHMNSLLIYYR